MWELNPRFSERKSRWLPRMALTCKPIKQKYQKADPNSSPYTHYDEIAHRNVIALVMAMRVKIIL
tara:strand:+ start:729 stop:923 length:195 start_codon:yes stop_codon:yes gene_type:complete